jgi:hypothetical protein
MPGTEAAVSAPWSRLARGLDGFWYPEAPAERLAVLRLAVGAFSFCYVAIRFSSFVSLARMGREFLPVGPLWWMTAPLPAPVLTGLTALLLLLCVTFTLGFRHRVLGPAFALLLLFLASYRSSFGMKFHTENLLVLQALVLGVSPAADALSLDARRRPRAAMHGRYGWGVRACAVLTVITYVLAGVAKLRLGGEGWMTGDILQAQIAYDNLRKIELGSIHSPLGVWLVPYTGLWAVMAWLTLAVELGAPLALRGGRAALIWSFFSWGFHLSVLFLMAIAFAYPLSTVPYLAFFRAERLLGTRPLRWMVRRLEKSSELATRPVSSD